VSGWQKDFQDFLRSLTLTDMRPALTDAHGRFATSWSVNIDVAKVWDSVILAQKTQANGQE
jgi:hypothetical protein